MPAKYSKLSLSPEFRALAERYQQARGIETFTGAIYELMARGWSDWISELDARIDDTSAACWSSDAKTETELFQEYDATPDAPSHFAVWFAQKHAPKYGGTRKGAGRPFADSTIIKALAKSGLDVKKSDGIDDLIAQIREIIQEMGVDLDEAIQIAYCRNGWQGEGCDDGL